MGPSRTAIAVIGGSDAQNHVRRRFFAIVAIGKHMAPRHCFCKGGSHTLDGGAWGRKICRPALVILAGNASLRDAPGTPCFCLTKDDVKAIFSLSKRVLSLASRPINGNVFLLVGVAKGHGLSLIGRSKRSRRILIHLSYIN